MSLPNIFKHFSNDNKASAYVFPDITGPEPEAEEKKPLFIDFAAEFQKEMARQSEEETEEESELTDNAEVEEEPETEAEEEEELTPVDQTQREIEAMLAAAREEAEQILERSREAARVEAELIYQNARESGHQDGYEEGVAQALEEGRIHQEEQAAIMAQEVEKFLEQANAALDRQMDENINELRDLAIAIAEKVVCISLRSSTDIIGRMVQAALDKRKHREWIHIYISESDAKRMAQIPATLTAAVSGLSDRVRIVPMADDDSGTLVIEMPDEIIDASASTQLGNIRNMLMNGRPAETDIGGFGNFVF